MQTLHHTILISIIEQRDNLMNYVRANYSYFSTIEEVGQHISNIVFSEQDILENQLQSIDLTVDDIDPNEYRDEQDKTISECCNLYLSLSDNQ